MADQFTFAAARFTPLAGTHEPLAGSALVLSVHGIVRFVLDEGGAGEHYVLHLATACLDLPPTDPGHGYDVHLWAQDPLWSGPIEVWLAGVHFEPATVCKDGTRVEIIGRGRGRSLYRADEVPPVALAALQPRADTDMTTYQTNAAQRRFPDPAPLDHTAVRDLARHANDVMWPAARMKPAEPLAEAGVHVSIALSGFNGLMAADTGRDHLAEGERTLDHLHRAAGHLHEHLVATVPEEQREARHRGMIDSCLREGLTVVASLTAELMMAGRRITVRLTEADAYQGIQLEEEGQETRTLRLSGRDRLELHSGLHEIGRVVWLMLLAENGRVATGPL
ncbi:hypothetical protein ACPC54_30315 [Kitasatospora sp. NPDC094028]